MKYRDKLTGRELTFTAKPDQLVVKFAPQADATMATRTLEDSHLMTPLYETAPARGYGVYQLLPEAETMDVATAALGERPDVEASLPVMVDSEGNERFFLPGEVTVQFADGVSEDDQAAIIEDFGAAVLEKHFTPGYYTLSLPAGKDLFEAIDELNDRDEVKFAEPSNIGFNDALYIPGDPDFSKQWALHNTGQTGGTADADVDAPCAWDVERGDPGVVIAIIDTGVDLDHPDLQANLVPQPPGEDWDFADPDLVPAPGPESWEDHGTHCAGIAAAVDNATGIVGMAPGCGILPIRIDLHGGKYQNRADAINFVTSIAGRFDRLVMSCSWRTSGHVAAIANAIIGADAAGVLVCFAAGNANADTDVNPQYPGVYAEVLSVAATDHNDVRASFSNFGSTVDVAAPGVDIYSTVPDDTYGSKSGTSMSCPLVAGLAGLVWSRNTSLGHKDVWKIIEDTADNIDALNPGFAGKLGSGRVNACRAVRKVKPRCAFEVEGKFRFPQVNAGSSSALTMYIHYSFWSWRRPWWRVRKNLLFLTQKPYSERIYFLDPNTGAVVRSIDPAANDTIGSMTWDGRNIRVANVTTGAGSINSIDPSTGAQVGSIPAPAGRGEGLTYDRRSLYYSTITQIHELDAGTGAVIRSFPVPGGGRCRALTDDGRSLIFAGDPFANEVIVFEKSSLHVVCRFPAPGGGSHRVDGLAYDPFTKRIYIANQSENVIYYGRLS